MNKKHDPLFRWQFANPKHTRKLLELSAKHNKELQEFLETVNLNSLERIPDTFSEVNDTGEADVAFRAKVSTGAPVLVGLLLEHKSGRDGDTLNQISRYVHSVMKRIDAKSVFDGLPTMAVIFYNGRENWNPLKNIEDGYPEYWRGAVLPFKCIFVNLADIRDEDCFAFDDVSTAMVVVAMKHAFNGPKVVETLLKFNERLKNLNHNEASCLLDKVMLYLREYLDENFIKELDMAFVSIGQKYGFVSAGDASRMREAQARQEGHDEGKVEGAEAERKKAADEKLKTARGLLADGVPVEMLVRRFNLTKEQIQGK